MPLSPTPYGELLKKGWDIMLNDIKYKKQVAKWDKKDDYKAMKDYEYKENMQEAYNIIKKGNYIICR